MRRARTLLWLLIAAPAVAQLVLLTIAVARRYSYPYDLEWMEGGLLTHAARITDGSGIYVPPSVDFIPYLYTPLYPGVLAALSSAFGLTYQLGRAVSAVSLLFVVLLAVAAVVRGADREDRGPGWAGGLIAAGLFAAAYPWFDGWYDLVRADTLFLALSLGGLYGVLAWARTGSGLGGHGRIAVAGALLAMSFFCKQTGVLFVVAGGAALLFANWRRVPMFVASSGLVGLGGTYLLDRTSGGWFWTYVFEVHQQHDFNKDRFWLSFSKIFGHFPVLTGLVAAGLVAVAVAAASTRRLPRSAAWFLAWSWFFAVATLAGALGWATQWAHNNAYIPAILCGAIAAGAAVPAMAGAASALAPSSRRLPAALATIAAVALALELVLSWWSPSRYVPAAADRAAGARLVARIASIEGDVLIPYHPWYAHLAGKRTFVHRMGVMDVTYRNKWKVEGLRDAVRDERFAAILLDQRPEDSDLPGLESHYRLDDVLPRDSAPPVFTGARVRPRSIWVPARPLAPPPGARALFDFEKGIEGWRTVGDGKAWGTAPVARPLPKQGEVRRYGGRFYLDSMHGGDAAVGTVESPEVLLDGTRVTLRIGGGKDAEKLRAELRVGDAVIAQATGFQSERMELVSWDVAAHRGQRARIRLVDESTGSWGHLTVDEIWIWQ